MCFGISIAINANLGLRERMNKQEIKFNVMLLDGMI